MIPMHSDLENKVDDFSTPQFQNIVCGTSFFPKTFFWKNEIVIKSLQMYLS